MLLVLGEHLSILFTKSWFKREFHVLTLLCMVLSRFHNNLFWIAMLDTCSLLRTWSALAFSTILNLNQSPSFSTHTPDSVCPIKLEGRWTMIFHFLREFLCYLGYPDWSIHIMRKALHRFLKCITLWSNLYFQVSTMMRFCFNNLPIWEGFTQIIILTGTSSAFSISFIFLTGNLKWHSIVLISLVACNIV